MNELDVQQFLAANFEGRIRLANQAHGARLWSSQLAEVWLKVLGLCTADRESNNPLVRRVMRELIVLAPHSEAAERAYHIWIGDNDRLPTSSPNRIVYLVISCEKYKPKAVHQHEQLSDHLHPIYIVLGEKSLTEAVFDGPFLKVPVSDNYETLPWKVLEGLVAIRRKFGRTGVLKIDDDIKFATLPRQDRISELILSTQYAGLVVGSPDFDRCWHVGKCELFADEPYRRRFRGSFAAGPLYYLGHQAVEHLVRQYLFFPGEFEGEIYEDKAIGDALRACGITPTNKSLSEVFGITGPFGGAFGDTPPALDSIAIKKHTAA